MAIALDFPFSFWLNCPTKSKEVTEMTIEKAQKDFDELITKNGFTLAGHTSDTGNPIYHRVWRRTVQVAWQGEQEDSPDISTFSFKVWNSSSESLTIIPFCL